jgi:hypothetical protein
MSRPLIVNNQTFNYPDPGEDPSWGTDASDWASAVTDVLGTLLAPGDILSTTFDISDDVSVATQIQGLAFDSSLNRSAKIVYSVYRTSTDNPSGNAETGTIDIIYDNLAPVGQKWKMTQNKNGEAGVVFSISDLGQFSYISTQIDTGSGGYSGVLKFSAKSTAI